MIKKVFVKKAFKTVWSFLTILIVITFLFNTCKKDEKDEIESEDTKFTKDFKVDLKLIKEEVQFVLFSNGNPSENWVIESEQQDTFKCNKGETVNSITIDVLNNNEVSITWETHDIVFDCNIDGTTCDRTWYSKACITYEPIYCYYDVGTVREILSISVTLIGEMPTSNNSNLSNLTISTGTLNPIFSSSVTDYLAIVENNVLNINVTPTAYDPNASINVNNIPCKSGTPSQLISLDIGTNNINIEVTSPDSSSIKNYSIIVKREDNVYLSNLIVSSGTLNPSFSKEVMDYTLSVSNSVTSVTVTPTADNSNSKLTVNGISIISGQESSPINLNEGENIITISVLAVNGITTKEYTIIITRLEHLSFVEEYSITNLSYFHSPFAISPDGEYIYIATSDGIRWYTRNVTTGSLTYVSEDFSINYINSISLSPDGKHIYVATDDAVAYYNRNTDNGKLTYGSEFFDNAPIPFNINYATSIILSSDGRHVYVTDEYCISWFNRNLTTGEITYISSYSHIVNSVVLSIDGNYLYATAYNDFCGLFWFTRNNISGELSYSNEDPELHFAFSATISSDDNNIYICNEYGIVWYTRDKTTGELTYGSEITELFESHSIALSPNGKHIYVATYNGLVWFTRDISTGDLTFGSRDLNSSMPNSILISPDSKHVYIAVPYYNKVLLFQVNE